LKDSHNTATNILLEELHPAAELISGWGPLHSMAEGVNSTFGAVFLIGYHARGCTVGGTLAHTWSSNVLELRVNDQILGEAGWSAIFVGHFNVPVVLVTGDDKLKAQVEAELPAGFKFVVTKTGWAVNAAQMRPLAVVREEIESCARRAVEQAAAVKPFKPKLPLTCVLRFRHWESLSFCAAVPGVERSAFDTIQFRAADVIEAQKYFTTLHRLAWPEK
jgi:D-amino peptidase